MNIIRIILDFLLKLVGSKAKSKQDKQAAPSGDSGSNPSTPAPPPAKPQPLVPVIAISPEVMNTTLLLGHYDEGVKPEQLEEILKLYHKTITTVKDSIKLHQMRHGDLFDWVKLKPIAGNPVQTLQTFLVNAGIMHPTSNRDGIFAYATEAGVRMFQEYVRIYENAPVVPTGIVDEATWKIMKDWQDQEKIAENWARGKKSEEYRNWMAMLKQSQEHYQDPNNPNIIVRKVTERINQLNKKAGPKVDTFPLDQWTFDEEDIHLIGIRRKEYASGRGRKNDDLFVLLINGMVFKFWGSTDPQQGDKSRKDEAFLSEGQHKFRFGWHNVSKLKSLYQALTPYNRGVLVFRDDSKNDNRLTDEDIEKGIDPKPNTTINIHWTGIGDNDRATWSAGCQVIAGKSYVDPLGKRRDCSAFAAAGSTDIRNNKENRIVKTKGAYNILSDLLLIYPPKRVDYLIYTLGRDDIMTEDFLDNLKAKDFLAGTLDAFDMEGEDNLA